MSIVPRSLQSWVSTMQSAVLTGGVFQFCTKNITHTTTGTNKYILYSSVPPIYIGLYVLLLLSIVLIVQCVYSFSRRVFVVCVHLRPVHLSLLLGATGWFKHKTPNSFRVQWPRRLWEIDPEILHVLDVPLLSLLRMFFFVSVYVRQIFGFLHFFGYLGLTGSHISSE